MNLFTIAKYVTYGIAKVLYDVRYVGVENIPKGQGYIVAPNHITAFDPAFVCYKIPQQLHFMAKAELFSNGFMEFLLKHLNAFKVERGTGDTGAIDEAERRVNNGGVLCIFIEGHRSEDGKPQRPKSGVAVISAKTHADVLPCAVICDRKLGFRSKVTVRYGELIKAEDLGINTSSPATIKAASRLVMSRIVELYEKGI